MKFVSILRLVAVLIVGIYGYQHNRSKRTESVKALQREVDQYTQQISSNPSDKQAHYKRGMAHRKLKSYQKAIDDFTEAIKLNPQHADAYRYRGLTHAILGNLDQANEDYAKSLDLDENKKTEG